MSPRHALPLAAICSALGWGLLLLALTQGWLGPDVDRGDNFCEASRPGLFLQPVSTLSNLAFTVAALAIGWRARSGSAMGALAPAYAVLVALLGPTSAAMHASESALGGELDTLAMYLIAAFVATYPLARWQRWSVARTVAVFAALVVACELVALIGEVPLVNTSGNAAFALLLWVGLGLEVWVSAAERRPRAWGLAGVLALTVAFTVWTQSQDDSPWCVPMSLLQGHGIWHALCGLSCWCLYRYYDQAPRGAVR